MASSLTSFSTRATAQTVKADPRQVRNAAGGYTFQVSDADRLHRFLTIGTDGGTYYASEKASVQEAGEFIVRDLLQRGTAVVDQILEVSTSGRAASNTPALFALALAASTESLDVRSYALEVMPRVARTASHLFEFLTFLQQHRGWGRQVRAAVSAWYLDKDVEALGYQVAKYRNRSGWTHRDVLHKAHTYSPDEHAGILRWIKTGKVKEAVPRAVSDLVALHAPGAVAADVIAAEGSQVSHEMLTGAQMVDPTAWSALLDADRLPITALIRQLPRLTRMDLLSGHYLDLVTSRLTDKDRLIRGRVHPVSVLQALVTYKKSPDAVTAVVDALDEAFYLSFHSLPSTNVRTLHAVDVSGSMHWAAAGTVLSACQAATALVMAAKHSNPKDTVVGFSHELVDLDISPRRRMDDVLTDLDRIPFGRTDCAAPMRYALERGLDVDVFVVYTDNETYVGDIHPHQALREYREKTGINAKLIVAAMTGTTNTIADPTDPGMLDISGFDAAVPTIISEFSGK